MHSFSITDLTRNISAAKKAAETGPVFITDRGKPRYVFQTIEAYHAQTGNSEPLFLEVMDSIDGGGDIDFEVPARSHHDGK